VVLDTIENARSRRRGTSNACNTCTQRNSAASGARASSAVVIEPIWPRNLVVAASSAAARTILIATLRRRRRRFDTA
jgi:hypothetical protein